MTGPGIASPRDIAVTDARSGIAHLVSEDAMAAGRRGGCYVAVCSVVVLAASLTAPERGHCQDCRRWRAEP